ncbi:hypothetical protein AB205_0171390 [Aquarana catesbeiana]|uniref:Uncharacterized protein n=1 Tax=Aquarana catesbeiana TaxID=8400 RepID=A0A2G9S304_AQUCT|nr:hypothetical protein AB205_0171390 [Aquarana catesbeiana]
MDEEFRRRLREMQIQHRGPVSEQVLLGWCDSIRCKLWKEALAREQRHQGKVLPSIEERYWSQYGLRVRFLGEKPHKKQTDELSRLVWAEIKLDESYRALRWHVSQACPWIADDSPTEGLSYGGLGLLYVKLTGDSNFGSDLEWRVDEIMDFREGLLNISEVHWAQEDLEFLAVQEWELEIAYRRLLDIAQCQGWAPFAWDYQEIPADNPEILAEESAMWQSNSVLCQPAPAAMEAEVLWRMQQVLTDLDDPVSAWDDLGWRNVPVQQHARESAVENLEIAIPKPEVLTTGQSSANLCPALIASSGFHGQEMVNLHPQTPVAETGDLIDFPAEEEPSEQPDEPPVEELLSGPKFTVLCPAPTVASAFLREEIRIQGENAVITSQLQLDLVSVDGASVPTCIPQGCWAVGPDPQQQDGVSSVPRSSLQRQKGLKGEGPVQASPQRQICSLREAEVGWVSNTLFGIIYLGYCVGTGSRGLELLTNFGVNPSGVSSCVSLLPKGERCDGRARGTQNTSYV